ncbi:FKBP-type peptidyl-prolyl cis-trans isomerase [Flocculibacter collagenilyticus]|uniref:FKBP-type peptidyl-prolyl cis-trans isomerase n=1 Tax=Flocculibacter collagenilyticus TaxID=2744479 RepID=UPI0018F57BA4|nr:FKBP-type peptidyl-prolyl cis-trans isomerase [Flocculibacter collagenilyticus]
MSFETNEQKACYGMGLQVGMQLRQNMFDGFDVDAIAAGIATAINNEESKVSDEEIQAAFQEISSKIQAERAKASEHLKVEGAEFLAENAKKDGVTVTESGLQYEVLTEGTGEKPTAESTVRTHYHGTFIDGKVFDSSYDRGQPAEFPVGGVIKGWTEALQMMPVGSKWRLAIPYELAYGEQGSQGAIPPFSTLVFDVELLEITG